MDIYKSTLYNGPNIGIYAKVNDDFIFIPNGFTKEKSKKISDYLETDVIVTSVANTSLLGILMLLTIMEFYYRILHLKMNLQY